jgi:superkiller protein 3
LFHFRLLAARSRCGVPRPLGEVRALKRRTRRCDRNLLRAAVVGCLWAAPAFLPACGGSEADEGSARAPEGLLEIPQVSLDRLETDVARTLEHRIEAIDAALVNPSASPEMLGNAFGSAGMTFHAHELRAQAEVCYRNAHTLMPEEFRWVYYLGQLQAETGNAEAAIILFNQALVLRPGDLPTLIALGQQHIRQLQIDEGERLLKKVLESDPSSAVTHFYLGQAAMTRQDHAAAVMHFTRCLELQPEATRVHVSLSAVFRALGDQARADQHLALRGKGALRLDDPWMREVQSLARGAFPLVQAGNAAFSRGEFESAVTLYRTAIEREADDATAWVNLGAALWRLGMADEATEAFEAALRLNPNLAQAHRNLGTLLAAAGDLEGAVEHQRRALERNPRDIAAHFNLANALRRLRRNDEALASFERVIELEPANTTAHLGVALCLVRQGRFRSAADELETATAAFPEDRALADATARLLAACPDDAVRDGRRAVSIARSLVRAERSLSHIETLAMAHAESGAFARAVELQRSAVAAAEKAGRADLVSRLRANLELYEAGRPCRNPWPED